MMIETSNLQVMDVMLDWAKKNIHGPKGISCSREDFDD
jgi:hypothetical protein